MMLTVGQKFPNFSLKGVVSKEMATAFQTITPASAAGRWKLFFFYPKDFTFVCPTELSGFNDLHEEFQNRQCQVYGISTDSEFVHLAWRQGHKDLQDLKYPLLSDIRRDLSQALGILESQEKICLRATFIVDPHETIRHASANDLSVGRNPHEFLRVLDALQTEGLTPCNWKPGQQTLKVA